MTTVRPRNQKAPKADHHHPCLTVLDICKWRRCGTLPPSESQLLLHNLAAGCAECWQAIDQAREMPLGEVLPTYSLEIQMLWSLTIHPNERRHATHRDALQQARSEPLGLFRLLVEEVLELGSLNCPNVVIGQGNYVKTLLGDDPPADSLERRIWHDLYADLESTAARAWAQNGEHDCAAVALNRAVNSCALGRGSAPAKQKNHHANINMLIARATCAFYQKEDVATWRVPLEEALALLSGQDDEPRRMEALNELACRLGGAGEFSEAHRRYLEAVCIAGKHREDHPFRRLMILHNLYLLEWRMAAEGQEDPPNFSLFFNLAMHHHNQAGPLYAEWGNPAQMDQARAVGTMLVLEGTRWAVPSGLRDGWWRLQNMEQFNPLQGLELLGLATVIGDAGFVEKHLEAVCAGFTALVEARNRLGGFKEELLRLRQRVDEETRVAVIDPWIVAVEKVSP